MKRADLTPRAPRHRILSREEIELWLQVTQTVAPITGRASEPRIPEAPPAPPVAAPDAKHPQHIRGFKAPFLPGYTPPPQYAAPGYAPGLAPLSPIERRLKQRLSRGRAEVDAVMDLHGLRQDQAHGVLRQFLFTAQASGAKLVLVITGKGGRSPDLSSYHSETGVLRRAAPQWLRAPEMRGVVIGFEEAAHHHGGAGAIYVRIRRLDRPRGRGAP
jgi:DNA-nicking Smr family endonuclease